MNKNHMKRKGFTPTPTFLGENKSKLVSGFTLIEIIIYMTLFSIMMGSLIVTVFQLIQNTEKMALKNFSQEEINFVFKKIDWAMSDAMNIDYPISGTSNELVIDKYGYTDNPITFRLKIVGPNYQYVELCVKNTDCNPITSKNIKVENLSFIYLDNPNQIPDGIKIVININGTEISNTKYLKL